MDFILHATMCKHIHFVKVYLDSSLNEVSSINTTNNVDTSTAVSQHTFAAEEGESSVLVETTSVHEDEISDVHVQFTEETTESCSAVAENDNPDITFVQYLWKCLQIKPTSSSTRDRAISLCKKIEIALLNCTNMDAIMTGMKHINAAYIVINAMEAHVVNYREFGTRKRIAPNTNFEKQTRFK